MTYISRRVPGCMMREDADRFIRLFARLPIPPVCRGTGFFVSVFLIVYVLFAVYFDGRLYQNLTFSLDVMKRER